MLHCKCRYSGRKIDDCTAVSQIAADARLAFSGWCDPDRDGTRNTGFTSCFHGQKRIQALLDKHHAGQLSAEEAQELDWFEEIDDYLSLLNRIVRNQLLGQNQPGGSPRCES